MNMIWFAFIHRNSSASTSLSLGELCVPALPLMSALVFVWCNGELVQDAKGKKKHLFFCRVSSPSFSFQDWLAIWSTWHLCTYEENGMSCWWESGTETVRGQDQHFDGSCLLVWFGGTVKQQLYVEPFSWCLLTTINFSINDLWLIHKLLYV